MLIGSAIGAGLSGMMSGIRRVNTAGNQTAEAAANGNTANLAEAMVEQRAGEIQVKAAANVVKAGDKMIGTIIDIRV